MTKSKILLAEDDESLGFLLCDNLEMNGFEVELCQDGLAGLLAFKKGNFDLCVLDVMMPKMDGFTLAKEIRTKDQETPIIFLTAKGLKEDRIKGFKVGGDDYLTKPFSIEEFILRINAILRRTQKSPPTPQMLQFGTYQLDTENLKLIHEKETKQLTKKEAGILQLFAQNQNKLLKREYILKTIWEDDGYFVGRSMDVFISRLRKLLEGDAGVKIVNVHGMGYRFEVEES